MGVDIDFSKHVYYMKYVRGYIKLLDYAVEDL